MPLLAIGAVLMAVPPAAAKTHVAHIRHEAGYPLPDRSVTPGRAFAKATPSRFCVAGYTARVRRVSESTRRAVFVEYGVAWSARRHYEVDHLVPLELGGSNSIRNLWPERGRIPNAKDGVENRLHNLVCRHQMTIGTARHDIATDWVRALERYGRTSHVYQRSSSPKPGGSTSRAGTSRHACTRTGSGSCIRGGEFCPAASDGHSGWDVNGHRYVCRHGHWEKP